MLEGTGLALANPGFVRRKSETLKALLFNNSFSSFGVEGGTTGDRMFWYPTAAREAGAQTNR